jgi:hypothetical protein
MKQQPVTWPLWSDPSDSLCYIIYTSCKWKICRALFGK